MKNSNIKNIKRYEKLYSELETLRVQIDSALASIIARAKKSRESQKSVFKNQVGNLGQLIIAIDKMLEKKESRSIAKKFKSASNRLVAKVVSRVTKQDNISQLENHAKAVLKEMFMMSIRGENDYDTAVLDQEFEDLSPKKRRNSDMAIDYKKKQWGIRRIVLDGIQNHVDAKGNVWCQCLIDGNWVNVGLAKFHRDKIKAVRFVDDGETGYPYERMLVLDSTKADDQSTVGENGEGLKLIALAALREGLDMYCESRNWRGTPVAFPYIVDKIAGKKKTWYGVDVQESESMSIRGSRTFFMNPSKNFLYEILNIKSNVLQLNSEEEKRVVFRNKHIEVLDNGGGKLYNKGFFIQEGRVALSYNFSDIEINTDRNYINSDWIRKINDYVWRSDELSVDFVGIFLRRSNEMAIEGKHYSQQDFIRLDSLTDQNKAIIQQAFIKEFGEDACIDSGWKIPEGSEPLPKIVKFNTEVNDCLVKAGIKTTKDIQPPYHEEHLSTSFVVEENAYWGAAEIMRDVVQNHLPGGDSGGDKIYAEFLGGDGEWRDLYSTGKISYQDIKAIRIGDNGRGFDWISLKMKSSNKSDTDNSVDNAAGKFGEGLKIVASSALSMQQDMIFKSAKNRYGSSGEEWFAIPETEEYEDNQKKKKALAFKVRTHFKDWESSEFKKYFYKYSISETIFILPKEEIWNEFKTLEKKFLVFRKEKPEYQTEYVDLLSFNDNALYVRGQLVFENYDLQFSYNLKKFVIKDRDRRQIKQEELSNEIAKFWGSTQDISLISKYLHQAALCAGYSEEPLEFKSDALVPEYPDLWIKCFRDKFGDKAVVRSSKDKNETAIAEATYHNATVVSVPPRVYEMLVNLRGKDGDRLITLGIAKEKLLEHKDVPEDQLTKEQKEGLKFARELMEYMGFKYEIKAVDFKIPTTLGCSGNPISLGILVLGEGKLSIANTLIHEVGHNETGAADLDSEFRNWFCMKLSEVVLYLMEIDKEDAIQKEKIRKVLKAGRS
ncbi:MAG: hypothetical protein FWG80_00895 [Alphaproteobacteria bacterium]|nr:hypothetical protein [Alphaproteobacteria bacterium]